MEDYKQISEQEKTLKNVIFNLQSEKDRLIAANLGEIYRSVDRDRIFSDKSILESIDSLKSTVEHENAINNKDLLYLIDMVYAPETNDDAEEQATKIEEKLRTSIMRKDSAFFITIDTIAKATQRHPVMYKVGAANALHLASSAISRNSMEIDNLITFIREPSIENRQKLYNDANQNIVEKITALNNVVVGLNNSYVTLTEPAKRICDACQKYDVELFKAIVGYTDFKIQCKEIEKQRIAAELNNIDKIDTLE